MKKAKEETFSASLHEDKEDLPPGTLPYAHTIGSAIIRPEDKGKIAAEALSAMRQQTAMQLNQIYEQMELLAQQAKTIRSRIEIAEMIYNADIGFHPLIDQVYHLYQRKDGRYLLSMIAPEEWRQPLPFQRFVASVRLLADYTWHLERVE